MKFIYTLVFILSSIFVNEGFSQLNQTYLEDEISQDQYTEQSRNLSSFEDSNSALSDRSIESAQSLASVIQVGQGNVSELSLQSGSVLGVQQFGVDNEVNIDTNGAQMNLNVNQIGVQNYFESHGGNQLMNGAIIQQNGNNLQMRMYHNQ